ncbi:MAG: hypothetical protein KAW12_24625 [Candidatus Aminicenantes bacterium]|nr:hypothetical protein [Candidatus Aminicenantes bacterium]
MPEIKIEKLTLKETAKILGGGKYEGAPGGTSGSSDESGCSCCCGCIPPKY